MATGITKCIMYITVATIAATPTPVAGASQSWSQAVGSVPPNSQRSTAMTSVDVDREARVVGDAAHQLIGQEDDHEWQPVAEEEARAAEQHRCEDECHREHIGRQAQAAGKHQDRDQHGVAGRRARAASARCAG